MKQPSKPTFATLALAVLAAVAGCSREETPPTPAASPGKAGGSEVPVASGGVRGKVLETMNSGGYTYVKVAGGAGGAGVWAAAPEFEVKVGDEVVVPEGMPMTNYTSKTLNRTFDVVYFVASISKPGAAGTPAPPAGGGEALPPGHPAPGGAPKPVPVDFSGIKKADGGKTIAEIFSDKAALAGKEVVVRGKVVKFNAAIMNKNWFHIKDGTGAAGSDDLTVTTQDTVNVGDTVLVRGTLAVGKDFGFGYKYDVLLEDAKATKE